jgi:hypothetical protein
MNEMERYFLHKLGYRVLVSRREYNGFLHELTMLAHAPIAPPVAPSTVATGSTPRSEGRSDSLRSDSLRKGSLRKNSAKDVHQDSSKSRKGGTISTSSKTSKSSKNLTTERAREEEVHKQIGAAIDLAKSSKRLPPSVLLNWISPSVRKSTAVARAATVC